jgi:hypothetical protein
VLLKFISESNNAVTDLGEIETRGVASRMYGGPTLNVATKMQNSQFYSFIKNKGGGEPTLKAVGPALPAPSAIVWSEATTRFAFLLDTTVFIYSTSPLQLCACSKVDTTNSFDDSQVISMKFIEETLFVSTKNSIVCCFISEGVVDVLTLASSEFTLVGTPGMSKAAAAKVEAREMEGPLVQYLPFPSPEIIGVVGTNLVLWNSLEMSTFHVKLDNPLLKSALLAVAGETARSARVLEGCKGK